MHAKRLQTQTMSHAGELAVAMAAAAEAAQPHDILLQHPREFAKVIWDRYGSCLLSEWQNQHRQFAALIHQLGMKDLAMQIANRLKVAAHLSQAILQKRLVQDTL